MTNKEYYSKENKTVKEMMEDFSKTGMKSYDEWLNVERISFSDEISFITKDGKVISASQAYSGEYRLEYVIIANDLLKSQNACFNVLLNDLDAYSGKLKMAKWSNNNDFIDDITALEDGIISGQEITYNVKKNHDLNDFPAFKICLEKNGFLPTIFQFNQLWKHKGEISAIMKKNGWKKPFGKVYQYWTSSQSNYSHACCWTSGGDWCGDNKKDNYRILCFFGLVS